MTAPASLTLAQRRTRTVRLLALIIVVLAVITILAGIAVAAILLTGKLAGYSDTSGISPQYPGAGEQLQQSITN